MTVLRYVGGLALLGAIGLSGMWAVQTTPLPASLARTIDVKKGFMAEFSHTSAGPGDLIRCRLTLDNVASNSVTFHWTYQTAGAASGKATQVETLSFQPTVIVPRSRKTNTVYVAGWRPRTSECVIEEWTLNVIGLGTAIPQGGGPAQTIMTTGVPSIQKLGIYPAGGTTSLPPLSGLACNPYGTSLIALSGDLPPKLYSIARGSGNAALIADLSAVAGGQVANAAWLGVGLHDVHGMVVIARRELPWNHYPLHEGLSYMCYVLQDADLDGTFESQPGAMTFEAFQASYPSTQWNPNYTGP